MPWDVKKTPSCPASKPFGVFKKSTGELGGRCHESRAKALAQMRALYASENKMASEVVIVNSVKEFSQPWLEGNKRWIKIYPFSSWSHPIFSDTAIDEETAKALKDSFDRKVYGDQELPVTYDHGLDPAKGGKAAGWYEQLDVRDDGLWGLVRFTPEAKTEIENEEWRYFSGEHWDEWTNPHSGETTNLVFSGGAVTNKPWVKDGCIPLNFSEVFVEREGMDPKDEHVEQEHANPGEEERPPDKEDKDNENRVDTPPDTVTSELDARIREALGLPADADIIKTVTEMHDEVKPLREAAKAHSEKKAFAEMYPAEAKELEEARVERMNSRAKAFSEQFLDIKDKDGKSMHKSFSARVIDQLEGIHKKFSEGTATASDLDSLMKAIGETGLVDLEERGSSRTPEDPDKSVEKSFADKVLEIQEEDKVDYRTAVKLAAERHPDLHEGYRRSLPGRR